MEYQAKELFAKHGVTTTLGIVVTTPEEARAAAEKLGFCVVKAQVKAGGRGKAGGVKLAKTPDEAFEHASNILGMEIKGLTVNRVLITPATPPVEEYYFSFLLDRANRQYLCIASVEGGVEIEEVAKTNPDAVKQIPINPGTGVDAAKAREIATEAKFPEAVFEQAVTMIEALFRVFTEEDATLVEVNPLARLEGDKLEALDGKVSLDDNASEVRHPDHEQFEIKDETDPLEAKAKERGLNYVKLDGQVGIIGNGAGLVMSTLDVVAYAGEKHGGVKPANFLDIGGGANAQVMADGLDVILHDAQVKSVFVNVFGGITACDEVANGIKGALEILGDEASKPLVVRLDGNNVAEGRRILDELNHPLVTQVPTMDGAADKAAELANGAEEREHVDLPQQGLQDHRPGHDGRDGLQAHHPHARRRLEHRRRRQRPQGRDDRRARRPGAAGLRLRQGGDDRDRRRRVGRLRAAGVHQGRLHRGDRRRHRAARGHHRGRARAGHRRGVGVPRRARAPG